MCCLSFSCSLLTCISVVINLREGCAFLVWTDVRKARPSSSALLSHENFSTEQNQVPSPWRRRFGSAGVALMLHHLDLPVARSMEEMKYSDEATPLLQVTFVTITNENLQQQAPKQDNEGFDIQNALYITVRPNSPDNVPRAILDGSRGKPPPVLIARIPNVATFPLTYILTTKDITVEGSATDDGTFWWQESGLVVSARLDSDGVAATRGPTDLVGRMIVPAGRIHGEFPAIAVQLQGRGPAGKFFTAKL